MRHLFGMNATLVISKKLLVRNILTLIGKTIRMFIVSPLLSKPDNLIFATEKDNNPKKSGL